MPSLPPPPADADDAGSRPSGRRLRWIGLGLAAALGLAAWAMVAAERTHTVEAQTMRALADLHRMRHATRALLSEREALPALAARWEAAVEDFSASFDRLGHGPGDGDFGPLHGEWHGIGATVEPALRALAALRASPLAGRVGDEGIEQTAVRLLGDRGATADLLLLRRLQRQLGDFDLATGRFAERLDRAALRLGERSARTVRTAVGCALLLLVGTLAATAWLLMRVTLLNLGLTRALASLRQSQREREGRETMLRSVVDSLGDGVALADGEGRVLWSNPALRRMAEAPDALRPGSLLRGQLDLRDPAGEPVAPQPGGAERRWLDLRLRRGAGELHIDLSAIPVQLGDGPPGMLLVLGDLTERHALEGQLRQAQSLETLGRLAGGVAHDFNNLLAGILGTAELLGARLHDRPDLRRRIDTIITASSRAAVLTRQLLESARRSAMQRGPLDLHALIRDSVALLERTLDRRVRIDAELRAPASWVDGDAALLQNALTNLAFNSRDAMPQGGSLTFATRGAEPPAGAAGDWLELTVADQGTGIPPEALPHIFEPFFTTKPVGRGTGLGLAAVLGTVTRHGGRVAVDSRPGEGTRFTILLPCCPAPASGLQPSLPQPTPAPAEACRVLLADDEEPVRSATIDQLREAGYQVQAVADGAEAVERMEADPQAVDLAILDVVMPRLGGVEVHRRLRRLRPRLPILLWSGYSGGQDVEPLLADGRTAFITKPASRRQLCEALDHLRRAAR